MLTPHKGQVGVRADRKHLGHVFGLSIARADDLHHVRIVDLSADFRLYDLEAYKVWYGHEHRAPELQKSAIYGLTEIKREAIRGARLVANPGCYANAALLALPNFDAAPVPAPSKVVGARFGSPLRDVKAAPPETVPAEFYANFDSTLRANRAKGE